MLVKRRLNVAIKKSVNHILSKQQQNGEWTDFELPVKGTADACVTGYVGYSLVSTRAHFATHKIESSLSKAAKWCIKNINQDGGWGYNKKCDTDADSTAYVILFLTSMNQTVEEKSARAYTPLLKDSVALGNHYANLD